MVLLCVLWYKLVCLIVSLSGLTAKCGNVHDLVVWDGCKQLAGVMTCMYLPLKSHMSCLQIQDASSTLMEQQRSLKTTAESAASNFEEDDQLHDTMLAAYWAAVNI